MNNDDIVIRVCRALVSLFSDQIEAGYDCVHTRVFSYVLHPEIDYVYCGTSVTVKGNTAPYAEHVVPCAILVDECLRLLKEKKFNQKQIASLLMQHWKIAIISKDEANILDSELKLKETMPEGWSFESGDTFARLKAAGIKLIEK